MTTRQVHLWVVALSCVGVMAACQNTCQQLCSARFMYEQDTCGNEVADEDVTRCMNDYQTLSAEERTACRQGQDDMEALGDDDRCCGEDDIAACAAQEMTP